MCAIPRGRGRSQNPHRLASVKSTRSMCIFSIQRSLASSYFLRPRHAFPPFCKALTAVRETDFLGKGLSPRSSLRLALPIPAGTPRNAPMPAGARSCQRLALWRLIGAALRSRGILVAAKRRRLGIALFHRLWRNIARARPFAKSLHCLGCAPRRRSVHGLHRQPGAFVATRRGRSVDSRDQPASTKRFGR